MVESTHSKKGFFLYSFENIPQNSRTSPQIWEGGKTFPNKKIRMKPPTYLEDHPMTCKWLTTMVSKSPKWGYSPYKWPFHGLQMEVTNYLRYLGWSSKYQSLTFHSFPIYLVGTVGEANPGVRRAGTPIYQVDEAHTRPHLLLMAEIPFPTTWDGTRFPYK